MPGLSRHFSRPLGTVLLLAALPAASSAQILGNIVVTGSQTGQTVRPGADPVPVFSVTITNNALLGGARLTSISFQSTTTGPGTQAQRDQDWQKLRIRLSGYSTNLDSATVASGVATFANLDVTVPPNNGSVTLIVTGGATLTARDGDALDLQIPSAAAVTISGGASGTFPIAPAGTFPVDGMVAKQVALTPVDTQTFGVGTKDNLALNVVVPANGYQADELTRVTVANLGTARAVSSNTGEIDAMNLWLDDGDGVFEPSGSSGDRRLRQMAFTGDRWQAGGLGQSVPVGGARVFVSVDIADAAEGRTIQLALPPPPDLALSMLSANDGLLDAGLANRTVHTIAIVDRVTLAAGAIAGGATRPGATGVPILDLIATNKYGVTKELTAITITNATVGTGAQSDLDGDTELLALFEDANDDRVLGPGDPLIGTAFYVTGRAKFSGFSWKLSPNGTRHLFLTSDVSLMHARDPDALGAKLLQAADLEFSDATALSAAFPISSGTPWTVDGMVVRQIDDRGAPAATLGPGEGPALGLDLVVPRNGYEDDVLQSVVVANVGSAPDAEIADLHLWHDGGDGQFDAGAGDDQDLGPLVSSGDKWVSGPLTVPAGTTGARLFVSVTAAATVTDSATVQLSLASGGLEMLSTNDGPLDGAVVNREVITFSDRALAADVTATPDAVIVGQIVTVRMTVRNNSTEDVNNVTPSALTVSGTAGFSVQSGPSPPSTNLVPGGQDVFTWTYQATSPGESRFTGSASGVGSPSGATRTSLPTTSNAVKVFSQPGSLPLAAATAMPLSVNRGQTNVVPLYLTFSKPSEPAGPDARVTHLRFRLEAQSGSGIVPANLLSRVAVFSGTTTYVERTSLETSGAEVDLPLATPILVTRGTPLTAALALDVAAGTTVPNFRIVVPDSTYFAAEDVPTGAPVDLRLEAQPYPIRTGLARVVDEATELDVAAVLSGPTYAGPGQVDAPLMIARLTNPGTTGVTSDVRVASFAVTLRDTLGAAVFAPGSVLTRLRVRSGPQLLADDAVVASEDSLIDVTLSPLLSVPVNSPLDIRITADLAPGAPLGAYRLTLAPPTFFDARDPNSGNPVTVVYATNPVAGDPVTLEARADSLVVLGVPQMPPSLGLGASGVVAMHAIVRHPGGYDVARVRLDSLAVRCVDESRAPLVPALYIDRMHVLWNGVEVTSLDAPPASGNTMRVALPGPTVVPGDRDTITVVLDFEATSPATSFELTLNVSGLVASDANTGLPVTIAPEDGVEFPLLSGLTRLSAPARTLIAGLVDHMPAALVADGLEVLAGEVTLRNEAPPGSGTIIVDRMKVHAADAGFATLLAGGGADRVRLYHGGTLWAEVALAPGDTAAALSGPQLSLAPGVTEPLELRFVPRASPSVGSFRLGFAAADVGVVQPGNPLLQVAVQPPNGQGFPLWTESGSFTAASLEKSYSNFPNPFAAGREPTTFAYYLPGTGRVTLRIWTPRGERVTSLLEDAPRAAGLHQSDVWDGRNGRGDVVANGVYVAELIVHLDGGGGQRLLRKLAVVR